MTELFRKLFRRKPKREEGHKVTPYSHWPHNIRIFYPKIYERDASLPAADAFEREYPGVIARFPKNAAIGVLMGYIAENNIDPV